MTQRPALALLGLLAAGLAAAVPARPQSPAWLAADTTTIERRSLEVMELVFQAREVEAEQRVDDMIRSAPDDPRPLLLRARLMRDRVSDQNTSRASIRPQTRPIHRVLDRCIAVSQRILDRDPDSRLGLLYRGWARMFKSQLHALAFEHWGAGREAKRGMRDIDRVLEMDPGNAEAHMIRGAYLYFAGILPSTLKIASFVLGIPRGDREEGLRSLAYAASHEGPARYDALGIYGSALFGFEGRLEDAIPVFDTLNVRFPDNPRLIEPLAVIDLFFAGRLGPDLPRMTRCVEAGAASPDSSMRDAAARLRFYLALTECVSGRLSAARRELERLRREAPGEPDWLGIDVDLYLTEVYLMLGQDALARQVEREARDRSQFRRLVKPLLEAAGDPDQAALTLRLQPVADALRERRLDEAEARLQEVRGANSLFLDFCRGELEFLRGHPSAAKPHFERMLESREAPHRRLLPHLAHLRLAEIARLEGSPGEAGKLLDEAVRSYEVKDLIRHVTDARARYCKRD